MGNDRVIVTKDRLRHQDRHPEYTDGCRACHFRSVALTYTGSSGVGTQESWHNSDSIAAQEKRAVAENTAKHGKDGFGRPA